MERVNGICGSGADHTGEPMKSSFAAPHPRAGL